MNVSTKSEDENPKLESPEKGKTKSKSKNRPRAPWLKEERDNPRDRK